MIRAYASPALLVLAAVMLPVASWWCAQLLDARGVAGAPFGDLRLVAVQHLATLPLAVMLARLVPEQRRWRQLALVVTAAIVLALPWWMAVLLSPVAGVVEGATPWIYHAARVGGAILGATGFAFALMRGERRETSRASLASWTAVLLVGVAPSFVYAEYLATSFRSAPADSLWSTWRRLEQARAIDGRDPQGRCEAARRQIVEALKAIEQAMPADDPRAKAEAIPHLLALDEHRQVEALLAEDILDPATARRVQIEIARRGQRWQEIITLLAEPRGEKLLHGGLDYDLLAAAYRGVGDWPAAEQLYRERLAASDGNAPHWHFQLARHYELSGRPGRAIEHYQAAADDAALASTSTAAIGRLKMATPTCLLQPWGISAR